VNIDTFKAKKLEFSHGSSYKRFYSVQDEVNYAKYNKRTVGPVTVDSDACYTILGGAGDASQLILDSGKALLKSGGTQIRLDKDGSVLINSPSGNIVLRAPGGKIVNAASSEVSYKVDKVDIKGQIFHKYIKVSK
jgi:hypothetical protein